MRMLFAALFISALMASATFAEEDEDVKTLATEELESRLEYVDKEISELNVQADYLKTEPPNLIYDPFEVERTGLGTAGRIRSELLNQKGDYDVEKRLKELRSIKGGIEMELDERDREAIQGGVQ